jgi:hypothetical protein
MKRVQHHSRNCEASLTRRVERLWPIATLRYETTWGTAPSYRSSVLIAGQEVIPTTPLPTYRHRRWPASSTCATLLARDPAADGFEYAGAA